MPLVGGPQQQPNYGLCGPAHTQLHAQLQPHEEVYEDRKNEFFPLKRFVFMSFGVPGAPSLSTEAQRCGSKSSYEHYNISSNTQALDMLAAAMCSKQAIYHSTFPMNPEERHQHVYRGLCVPDYVHWEFFLHRVYYMES